MPRALRVMPLELDHADHRPVEFGHEESGTGLGQPGHRTLELVPRSRATEVGVHLRRGEQLAERGPVSGLGLTEHKPFGLDRSGWPRDGSKISHAGQLIARAASSLGAMGIEIEVTVGHPVDDEVERVLGLAEAVGEPVTVAFWWEGREAAERMVLVPAATLALWEHWAPVAYPRGAAGDEKRAAEEKAEPEPAHPAEFGAFTLFRRRVGGRTAVARQGVVVAELLDPAEAHWLQEQARTVRQGFMDPKQNAAFEEFLARQASLDER